jgi:arginase
VPARESKQRIHILGIPMDLGQTRRGVDMGPSALRYAGLQPRLERLGHTVIDEGNVVVPQVEQLDDDGAVRGHAYNVGTIARICAEVRERARVILDAGDTLVALGGDHSLSIGTVAGALARQARVGVLWIDAHGDFNTPQTTPSGSVHGMVVASLAGLGDDARLHIAQPPLAANRIAMIGIRDLDDGERALLRQHQVYVRTMRDIDEQGIARVMHDALAHFEGVDVLHVSLDMDALDPQVAPGVGTPVSGGLTYREAHLVLEMLADDGRTRSLDIVEINPILDTRNTTASLAVELAGSLFGQRIL